MSDNTVPQNFNLDVSDRNKNIGHKSLLLWFTGLSGSGKSTIANKVEVELYNKGIKTYILDGDNIRNGLNKDLGFSPEDRTENIRRIAEISKLMIDSGLVVLAAFVSPYKKDRKNIRRIVKDINFVEIFVNTSLEECERRDVKGLYKKARRGEIKNMTGISAPYEKPENPSLELNTEELSLDEAVDAVLAFVSPKLEL